MGGGIQKLETKNLCLVGATKILTLGSFCSDRGERPTETAGPALRQSFQEGGQWDKAKPGPSSSQDGEDTGATGTSTE